MPSVLATSFLLFSPAIVSGVVSNNDDSCAVAGIRNGISRASSLIQAHRSLGRLVMDAGCAAPWAQCGGQTWKGATCCTSGYECVHENSWYSGCRLKRYDSASGCAAAWQQCGGFNHKGATCCVDGFECTKLDDWYSQCSLVAVSTTTTTTTDAVNCTITATTTTLTSSPSTSAAAVNSTVTATTTPVKSSPSTSAAAVNSTVTATTTPVTSPQSTSTAVVKSTTTVTTAAVTSSPSTSTVTDKNTTTATTTTITGETTTVGCALPWAQCGGKTWDGATCCTPGYECVFNNSWFSGCRLRAHGPAANCAAAWGQCGGNDHKGATCCVDGFECIERGEWYSQCSPVAVSTSASAPKTTVTATVTGSTTATTTSAISQTTKMTTAVTGRTTVTTRTVRDTTTGRAATTTGSPKAGQKFRGTLTMWSTQESLLGAQCEYANPPVNSISDPVMPSYLRKGFHCAIGDSGPGFGVGEHCGKCYKVTSLNDDGTAGTPGSKGSAVVMVSDGGAGGHAHFDCILDSFKEITGAETGIFDIEFEQTLCDEVSGGPVVINWADQNAWYCKMMFENVGHWGQLESVRACLDNGACENLQQFSGATWTGCPKGKGSSMTFELTQRSPDGVEEEITCVCSGEWPWPTGQRCSCPKNFGLQ